MKSQIVKWTSLMVLLSILVLQACKKENELDTDILTSRDNALAEQVFSNVALMADEAYDHGPTSKGTDAMIILGNGVTISLDTVANPHQLIIDFGSSNILCNDGRFRRGKVLVAFTGPYRQQGTVITITFDKYHVNDHKVDGTKTITNQGLNSSGNPSYDIQINGSIEKANNGGTITWNSSRTREWVDGDSTLVLTDDIYHITGSANGVSSAGNAYTIQITKELRRELACKHIVSGTFTLDISGKNTRTIDYGNGVCDNVATVSILNQTFTITLN